MKKLRKNLRKVGSACAAALALGLLPACTAAQRPVPVTPASSPAAPEGVNPFAGARFYVNPDYARMIEGAAARAPADGAPLLKKLAALPTAIWLSSIADLGGMQAQLDDALKQQTTSGQPVVPVFVVYDLPGRDCNAEASAGELPISEAGEARYQREYIDVIAAQLRAHPQDRKSTRLNSSHTEQSRMPSSA